MSCCETGSNGNCHLRPVHKQHFGVLEQHFGIVPAESAGRCNVDSSNNP